jgi:hypothetical protein
MRSGSSLHGTLTQAPLEQMPVQVSVRFQTPSAVQVSTVASVPQRVAPGAHSPQPPATHTGVTPVHVTGFQAPLVQTRPADEDVHSFVPSVHTQLPPEQTGVSPRQSDCWTQAPADEQTIGVLASRQSTAFAAQPHTPVAAMH